MRIRWGFRKPISHAARRFARLHAGSVAPEAQAELEKWCAARPQRAAAYALCEVVWNAAGELKEDSELRALLDVSDSPPRKMVFVPQPMLRKSKWIWSAVATVCCFVGIGIGAVVVMSQPREKTFSTGVGEQQTFVLADGSRMTLNTNTLATVVYRKHLRTVRLDRGEATFAVMHEAERPFLVSAAGGVARAVGTEFNVLREDDSVVVSVLEGRVAVMRSDAGAREGSASFLNVGEAIHYEGAMYSDVVPADIARIRAWQNHRIELQARRLADVLTDFNRYTSEPIVLGDSSLQELRVTGTLSTREPSALIGALKQAFDLRVIRSANTVILLPAEKSRTREELPCSTGGSRSICGADP